MSSTQQQPVSLRVIAGGGASSMLAKLGPAFETEAGVRLVITYDGAPALIRRFTSGEAFDVTVVPLQALADAAARAAVAPEPTTDLARVGIGLAVPAGAAKPDIATPDALRRTLLAAKSVTLVPESANGAHILKVFGQLGIAAEMAAKLRPHADPLALVPALARGEAELGLYVTNLLLAPGIDFVGSLPDELNTYLTLTAGLSAAPAHPHAARAFLAYLSTPSAAAAMRDLGMEPPC